MSAFADRNDVVYRRGQGMGRGDTFIDGAATNTTGGLRGQDLSPGLFVGPPVSFLSVCSFRSHIVLHDKSRRNDGPAFTELASLFEVIR